MYCQVCGTQLSSEARACPKCGTLVAASSPNLSASAYDPTVPAGSGSSPSAMGAPPIPPTQYSENPYGNPVQSPYPFNPYEAPPPLPTPTRRSSKRTGLIVGLVLLVLLLIGGGVALFLHLSAAANFTANGTFTILDSTTNSTTQSGQDTVSTFTEHAVFNGDMTGSYTFEGTFTLHPDKTATISGTITCICTVSGKSGTLQQSLTGTQAADGSFQGQVFNFQGTGDLANLHGQGTFQGKGNNGTYSAQLHFGG